MVIHISDTRLHPFPRGWYPESDEQPLYLDDRELWVLARDE